MTPYEEEQVARVDELTAEYKGQEATPELCRVIYELYGVRISAPGYLVTTDIQPFRLNMEVDEQNIIQGFYLG